MQWPAYKGLAAVDGDSYALINTKLNRPRISTDLILRRHLIERLNGNLDRKLTLVAAPAGYGKTTLVAAWMDELDRPYAWLSLDSDDNGSDMFLRYVIAAIRQVDPEACPNAHKLLDANQPPSDSLLITTLINDLAELPHRLVLVLDDCHLLTKKRVLRYLSKVVEHQPLQVHLVLITRADPPLPLQRLRVQGMLSEVRSSDLRLSREETRAFFRQTLQIDLPAEVVGLLDQRTEGWITGLRLASLSMQHLADPASFVRDLAGHKDTFISEYLLDEVLAQQTKEVQQFLMCTSILNRFCAPLCDHLLGSGSRPSKPSVGSQPMLERIDATNLFLVPLDDAHGWYRYHHLFQELLQSRLLRLVDRETIASMHALAGAWLRQEGYIEEAARHFIDAGDLQAAAETVEENLQRALNQEARQRIEHWLSLLPEDLVWQRPHLLAARSWILHWQFRLAAYAPLINRARELVEAQGGQENWTTGPPVDGELQGQINALRGQVLFWASDIEDSLHSSEQALAQLPGSSRFVRSIADLYRAFCLQELGRGDQAIRDLDRMLDRERGRDAYVSRLLFAKVVILFSRGALHQLESAAQQLRIVSGASDMRLSIAWAHHYLGLLYYEWDNLELSEEHLSRTLDLQYHAHLVAYRDALVCLALNLQAQGLVDGADAALAALSEFAQQMNNQFHHAVLHSAQARLLLQRGDVEAAAQSIARVDKSLPLQPMVLFEIPQLTMAKVLVARRTGASLGAAERMLDELSRYACSTDNTRTQIALAGLQALLHEARGRLPEALAELEKAVTLARPGGFVRTFVELGPIMATLLRHLATRGIARAYIAKILLAFPAPELQTLDVVLATHLDPLTDQELRVLQLLQSRLTNKEIANTLVISPNTVKRHTINVYRKLDVSDRKQAVAKAEALGLLPLE